MSVLEFVCSNIYVSGKRTKTVLYVVTMLECLITLAAFLFSQLIQVHISCLCSAAVCFLGIILSKNAKHVPIDNMTMLSVSLSSYAASLEICSRCPENLKVVCIISIAIWLSTLIGTYYGTNKKILNGYYLRKRKQTFQDSLWGTVLLLSIGGILYFFRSPGLWGNHWIVLTIIMVDVAMTIIIINFVQRMMARHYLEKGLQFIEKSNNQRM